MHWWDFKALRRIDFRALPILLALMSISLLVISSVSASWEAVGLDPLELPFLTSLARSQLQWFLIGSCFYLAAAALDYRALRSYGPILYLLILLALVGLFFTPAVHNVHRWYRLPGLPMTLQPSEYAKWIVVVALSAWLEKRKSSPASVMTVGGALAIVGVPFLLILKQPDLGTALVLYPIALVMFYFGGLPKMLIRIMSCMGVGALTLVALFFTGVLSHEEMRPIVTKVIREYQYERLNPHTYHQEASQTAIALGGVSGSGWRQSEFTGHQWLPEAHTDSVFPAFTEEFGAVGAIVLLGLFAALIALSFQVTAVARDSFGRLLSAGIAVYLAMHVVVNVGMMAGLLPITGVPLTLVTYGGSSVLSTMMALGLLQSVYARRYG